MKELVVALIAAIILEFILHPIRWLHQRFTKPLLTTARRKIAARKEQTLHRATILRSLESNSSDDTPVGIIADAIERHKALVSVTGVHYADVFNAFHISRRFKLFPLLNGTTDFFPSMCRYLSSKVNFHDVNLVLCLKKEYNLLFSMQLLQHFPRMVLAHHLICKEKKNIFSGRYVRTYDYEEAESLEGTKVVLIEALNIYPNTLVDAVNYIRSKGATICKVVVLFDAADAPVALTACGIKAEDVIIAAKIDLELKSVSVCGCANSKVKTKRLRYAEY